MPTVIDSLVVTLGLDASKYKSGSDRAQASLKKTREEAAKTAKDMQARGKEAAEFFSKLRNEALMFVGALAGYKGVKDFTTSIVGMGTSLGRMSTNLSMSVRDLRAWELAARNAGGTTAGIDAQLKESQNAVAMARRGYMPEGAQEFYLQGGTDIRQFRTGTDYLRARLAIVERIEKTQGISAARLSASRMGLDDSQFSFFRLGASGVSASVDQFRKLAGYTEADTKHAIMLTQKFDLLGDKMQLTGIRIGTALMPYLDKILDWFTKLATWVDSHQDTIKEWMDTAIETVKAWWKELDHAVQSIGGWKNVLLALGAIKVLSWISPFNALAAALGAVGAAMGVIAGAGPLALAALAGVGTAAVVTYMKDHKESIQSKYNPSESQINATTDRAPGNTPAAQRAMDYFTSRGYTREGAAAIVGSFQQESGMRPDAVNGSHFGLAQWSTERQANFKRVFGFDIHKATFDQQLAFADWELHNTHKSAGNQIRDSKDWRTAAHVVYGQYESPGDNSLAQRMGNTLKLLAESPIGPVAMVNSAGRISSSRSMSSSNISTEVNVNGPITITTNATDAKGVADGLKGYINTHILATQTNTGLQ